MTDPAEIAATALRLKDEGNVAYKENRYHNAIRLYTESLKLEKSHIVFGNRAQSYMNIQQFELALRDLNEAVVMNPKFTKNTNRRSKVLAQLGMCTEARVDNETSLRHAPKDKSALLEKEVLKGKENARYTDVMQWNLPEEFEEDEMVSIPILDLVSPLPPTVPEQVIEDTVSPTDTVLAADVVDTTVEEDTVAPADLAPVEDTVSTEEKKEEVVEAAASETVDESEDSFDTAPFPSVEDTVVGGSAESEKDTVVVAATSDTTVHSTSPTKSTTSTTVSPSDDSTFVSAPEPERTTSGASWTDVKDESFSSISDLHSSVEYKSVDGFMTSPTSPNETVDDEEKEEKRKEEKKIERDSSTDTSTSTTVPSEPEVKNEESTVVEEDTVLDKKEEDTVDEKNGQEEESTVAEEKDTVVKKSDEEEKATVIEKNEETTVVDDKEEDTVDEQKEEATVIEKKEEATVIEKKEEATVVEKNEEATVIEKKEEPTVIEKKEEATVIEKKEEDTAVEKNQESTAVEKEKDTVVTAPLVIPPPATNYLDFVNHFDRLKRDPEAFGKYFLTMNPSSLLSIFVNLIQLDHVKIIIEGLTRAAKHDMADLSVISSHLLSVSLLPRFDLVVLFMNDDDRAKALSLIDLLPSTAKTAEMRQLLL